MEKEKKLTACFPGQKIRICRIDANGKRCREMMVFGLKEGMIVRLLQVKPMPILQIGFTEVAIDPIFADCIWGKKVE